MAITMTKWISTNLSDYFKDEINFHGADVLYKREMAISAGIITCFCCCPDHMIVILQLAVIKYFP